MTKEMMEDLLNTITILLEDLREIQTKSHQIDELYTLLENRANNIEIDINDLEENAKKLDEQLALVLECREGRSTKNLLAQAL